MMGLASSTSRFMFLLLISSILYSILLYDQGIYPRLIFFDVGQGDASLIKLSDEVEILIDGGPDSFFVQKLQKYLNVNQEIDYVVLTHPHEDHMLGLVEVVKRYRIRHLVLPTSCVNNDTLRYLIDNLSERTDVIYSDYIKVNVDSNGYSVSYGETVEKCFESQKDVNNSSVVLELDDKGRRILYVGDVETEREVSLISSKAIPSDIEILKAGHHCSNSSSSYRFLEYLSPSLVICSYGKDNSYGHPGNETLSRFNTLGIKHIDTVKAGDIVINLE
ncbi:MBL fold metallo-hydrolase [Candidatus Dojkabacteria bacterium]|nr:MBL fold metallo-hydrolase [Candidatus Dojkabacteria bacterium]